MFGTKHRMRRWAKLSSAAAAAVSLLAGPAPQAPAATDTYNSTGTATGSWDAGSNWSTAAKPTSAQDAVFASFVTGATAPRVISLSSGELASSLDFADVYNLSGGSLALTTGNITVDDGITFAYPYPLPSGTTGSIPPISLNSSTIESTLTGPGGLTKLGGGTLYLGAVNTFTGSVSINAGRIGIVSDAALGDSANTLTLNGGALAAEDNLTSARAITIGAGGGTFDVSLNRNAAFYGSITNSGTSSTAFTKTGLGTLAVGSPMGFTGAIVLATNGGTLRIQGSSGTIGSPAAGSITAASSITINPSATLLVDNFNNFGPLAGSTGVAAASNTDRIADTIPITMNGGTLSYSAANIAGKITETVGAVTLASGYSTLTASANGSGGELSITSLARNFGTTVNFTTSGTAGASGNNGRIILGGLTVNGTAATLPTTGGLIGGWAVLNSTDFAGYTTYSAGVGGVGAVSYTNNTFSTGTNTNLTASQTLPTGGVATLTGALKFGGAFNVLFSSDTDTLDVESGGILSTNANQSNAIGQTGETTAGTFRGMLTAGGATGSGPVELFIHQNQGTITINSFITDNTAQQGITRPLTLIKDGGGALILTGNTFVNNNTYSGGTILNNSGDVSVLPQVTQAGTLGTGAVQINNTRLIIAGGTMSAVLADGTNQNTWTLSNFTYSVANAGALQFTPTGPIPRAAEGFQPQTIHVTGGSELAISGSTTANSLVFSGTGQNIVADPGSVIAETASGVLNDSQFPLQGMPSSPTYFFGIEGNFADSMTVGATTPWLGVSTGRGNNYTLQGGTTITYNSDFALQSFLFNNTFRTLTIGNGTGATNAAHIVPGTGVAPVNVAVNGNITLNNDVSTYQGVTFTVSPGSTLLLNTATALGGGGTANASQTAGVIVQAGGTLNLNGGIANAINGNVTFEPGSTFQADDTLTGGTLNGTGTLTFQPGSYITLSGTTAGTINALNGTQLASIPAGVIIRLNGNTSYGNGEANIGALNLSSKIQPTQIFEAFNGGTNTLTTATNTSADNLNLSGAILTATTTGGTINEGGGRIIVGAGGVTLAGGATIAPSLANDSSATFSLQEDFDLAAPGNTLTVGYNGTVGGNPKFGSYVALTGQGSRSVPGGIVDVTAGAQLQLSGFYTVPDLATLRVESGTSVLLNTNGVIETVGQLSGSGSIANNQGAGTLQVGYGDQSSQFDGIFAAAGTAGIPFDSNQPSLNKIGAGTLALTGASTSTGTMTVLGGSLTLTGASGTVKFGTVTLGRGTLVLDNTAGVVPNRLGGTVSTGPTLNFAGGDLTLSGGGSETVGSIAYNLGGQSNLNLQTGTLTQVTVSGNGGRSISTVILHGTKLGAGGTGNAAFAVNNPGLSGTAASGQITTGIRSDILTDSSVTGTTLPDPVFATYDATANSYRGLTSAEMTSNVYAGQNVSNNVLLAPGSSTSFTFPVPAGIPNQPATFGVDTQFQSLTMGNGSSITQAGTINALGAQTRLNINGSAVDVQANSSNGGAAAITAPYLSGVGFIYVNDAGQSTVNSLTINGTIVSGSGTAAIVKAGNGTLNFGAGAINFYDQGNFSVNAGTVNLLPGNSFFFSSTTGYALRNVWLAGGTLDLRGNSEVVGNLTSSNTLSQMTPGISAGNIISTGAAADIVTTGNSTFYGTISGIGNLTREGNSTTSFRNAVTLSGALTSRGGTLALQDAGKITGATSVNLNFTSLQLDNIDTLNFNQNASFSAPVTTDRIPSTVPVIMDGSQLRYRGAGGVIDSQTFGNTGDLTSGGTGTGVRIDAGANEILAEANGNASTNLTITNLVRATNAHSFVNFTGSNVGNSGELYQVSHFTVSNINGAALANSGATGTQNSMIAPWAVVNGGDFATYNTASFTSGGLTLNARGLANMGDTANGYAGYSAKTFNAASGTTASTTAADIISTGATSETAGVTSRTIGAIRLNNGTTAGTFTLNSGELLTLANGGFIANTANTMTITGGSITSGYAQPGGSNNELYFWANQNTTTLASSVVDNSTTPVAFIRAGGSSLVMNGTNSYTGGTYLLQGTTTLSGTTTAIPLANSTLGIPDLTLYGNVSTATSLVSNTNAQIASGAKVELDGFATLRLNDTAAGTQILNGITFNNTGGTAAPVVQVAGTTAGGTLQLNGNIIANNFNFTNVPTLSQNLATASTTPAALDLGGATRTIDVEGQNAVGTAFGVNGQSVTGLNIQLAVADGGIIKTGAGTLGIGLVSANLTGGSSVSTLTGGITINAGVVRADSAGALGANGTLSGTTFTGGNTVTVNAGTTLLANPSNTTFTGNIALLGGTLQALNSTETFSGPMVIGQGAGGVNPTIAEQDFFNTGTVNRGMTLSGLIDTDASNPTINVTAAPFAGSTATLLLSNGSNNLTGATVAIGVNAIVTAKPATPFTGNPLSGAAITMAGGQLNVDIDGTNPAPGNNVTVSGPAAITAGQASASTNQTLTMGTLTLQPSYNILTTTANNGYTLAFSSTSAPTAPLNLNVTTGTVNLGAVTGSPTALNKYGAGTQLVTSWTSWQSAAPALPININQGILRTTSGNGTTALTSGPLSILYNATLYNDSGSGNTVTYSPSSVSSQGLIQAHTGTMNFSGYFLQNPGQAASSSPEFSNLQERWFNTLGANTAADDALITLSTASGNFLNSPPTAASTTGLLKDQYINFTDAQSRARGRTTTNLMGALITGVYTPTVTGPVSFGLNSDDGSSFYLNWDNPGNGLTFDAADLIVSNMGAHAPTVATGATPILQAGVAYPFAIGYYNSGSGGLLEARYTPGVVGAGASNGSQAVPFANQTEINPGKTPNTQLEVDTGASLTTSGFNAETVLLSDSSSTATATLTIDSLTKDAGNNPIPSLSTAQILYADSGTAGSNAKIDIAAGKVLNITQSIGVNANATLTKTSPGTLLINSLPNTGVTASPGKLAISAGVVGGSGTLTVGSVVVNTGGTISAGTSTVLSGSAVTDQTGLLVTTGSQTWTGGTGTTGGTYAWKLNVNNAGTSGGSLNNDKTGANWDQLTMNSLTLTASSTSQFNIEIIGLLGTGSAPFDATKSYAWTAANAATSFTLPANAFHFNLANLSVPNLNPAGFSVSEVTDGTLSDFVINYAPAAAPEPTSLALLGLAAGGLMLRRRRRSPSES